METEPIVAVRPDGQVQIGKGVTVGQVLEALEVARRAVLGLVLNAPKMEPPA